MLALRPMTLMLAVVAACGPEEAAETETGSDPSTGSTGAETTSADGNNPTSDGGASGGTTDTMTDGNDSTGSGDGTDTGATAEDSCSDTPDDMVCVPAGPFSMGCNGGDCDSDEVPYHTVHLDSFDIDRHEVTVERYEACVQDGACTPPWTGGYCNFGIADRADHPVNCVLWEQAVDYCTWVGRRLPSEAEWEKAARGTDGRTYPWGNEPSGCDYAVMYTFSDGEGCGRDSTWPVGSKPAGASPYGVLDMAGNIGEWVQDWYDGDYYEQSPDSNPQGPPGGTQRVVRGGSWESFYNLQSTHGRWQLDPADSGHQYGFRCAR
jgi:formylglycine-generating enzyme required for sulfatase activity